MNAEQRKRLDDAIASLEHAKSVVDDIASEHQDAFDELSEKAQEGPNGEKISEAISALEEASGHIEDAVDVVNTAKGG